MTFVFELLKVLLAIGLLGLAGAFLVEPFRAGRQFLLLLSPMCGMLILPPLVTLLYAIAGISFAQSAAVVIACCSLITFVCLIRYRPSASDLSASIAPLVIVAAISTGIFCSATVTSGSKSMLYIDGSDHGGYAQAADWLLSHYFGQQPVLSQNVPYDSWPFVMFTGDVRYSAFVSLALMAIVNRSSGLFAYDLACAVAFSVACLSIGAVFARSKSTLLFLSSFLLTCIWFELGRDGFFGKLMAYPACLFLLGLFITSYRAMTQGMMAAMVLITIGAATMHSGFATAFVLAAVGGLFVCVNTIFERNKTQRNLIDRFLGLAVLVVTAIAINGMFSHPVPGPGSILYTTDWLSLFPDLFEIRTSRHYFTSAWLPFWSLVALVLQLALAACAIARRDAVAVALTAGPLLIFAALISLDAVGSTSARFVAFQLIGIIASYGLCGTAVLLDGGCLMSARIPMLSVAALSAALILVRLPRTIGSLKTYVFKPPVPPKSSSLRTSTPYHHQSGARAC